MTDPRDRLWFAGLTALWVLSFGVYHAQGGLRALAFLGVSVALWTAALVVADIFAERRRVRAVTRRLERHCKVPCRRCHSAHTEEFNDAS